MFFHFSKKMSALISCYLSYVTIVHKDIFFWEYVLIFVNTFTKLQRDFFLRSRYC